MDYGWRNVRVISPAAGKTSGLEKRPDTEKSQPFLQTNSMLRLFVRKKLVQDLARVPLFLDFSAPQTVYTVNSLLKTLDDLARLINSPGAAASAVRFGAQAAESQSRPGQAATTGTEGHGHGRTEQHSAAVANTDSSVQPAQNTEQSHVPAQAAPVQ